MPLLKLMVIILDFYSHINTYNRVLWTCQIECYEVLWQIIMWRLMSSIQNHAFPRLFSRNGFTCKGWGRRGGEGGGGEKLYLVHQNLISFTRQFISPALHPGSFQHFNVTIKRLKRTRHKGFLYNNIGNQSWNTVWPEIFEGANFRGRPIFKDFAI